MRFEEIVVWGARTHRFGIWGGWLTAGGLFMAVVAESKVLGDEVGFLGEKGPDDSPDDSEQEHRHL